MANIRDSLSHTKWLCKYHIVFTPKYRRKAIYGQYKESIGQILRQLCNYKGVEIVEGHLMPDHVHMLVSIPPKYSVSQFMGYLKGKSSLMIFDKHANLKYKFGNRHFWAEGYYVSTVGLNEATIAKYIREQESHDIAMDKIVFVNKFKDSEGLLRQQETLWCSKIFKVLRNEGETANLKRIQRRMTVLGIMSVVVKNYKPVKAEKNMEQKENILNPGTTASEFIQAF